MPSGASLRPCNRPHAETQVASYDATRCVVQRHGTVACPAAHVCQSAHGQAMMCSQAFSDRAATECPPRCIVGRAHPVIVLISARGVPSPTEGLRKDSVSCGRLVTMGVATASQALHSSYFLDWTPSIVRLGAVPFAGLRGLCVDAASRPSRLGFTEWAIAQEPIAGNARPS